MEQTFNLGLGMVAVVAPDVVDQCINALSTRGVDAWVCGTVRKRGEDDASDAPAKGGRGGSVQLVGRHSG